MKKIFLLAIILFLVGCEKESDDVGITGYTPTGDELDPTKWEGTD